MAETIPTTIINGTEWKEVTQEKRKGKFAFFFNTEWWETVSTKHLGSDIYVKTYETPNHVYVNGVEYKPNQ